MTQAILPYSLENPLKFDIEGASFKRDPFATFAAMRDAGAVLPLKLPFVGRTWVTTTHEAALAMVKDHETFVMEGRHAGKSGVAGMQWWMPKTLRLLANNMLLKDEPDHRRLRKLVDTAFKRRDVLAMRGNIESRADSLLDGFDGETDLLADYARQLPLAVICDLLGLPEEDRGQFSHWTRSSTSVTGVWGLLRAVGPLRRMLAYVRGQIEDCRRTPRHGLISALVQAEEDGDKLDADELVSMIFLLLVAGFETTTHLIGDSIIALELNPRQKAWLLEDPAGRMQRAVEELARFTSPVQSTKPRYVARDTVFCGQPLRRGDIIMALIASANADPAEFDAPEQLRLDRFPNPHLVFSSGIHFCLGLQLARVEAQSALARLYTRYPDLEIIDTDALPWIERLGIRGVSALPVRLNRPAIRLAA
jgi:cytochrome P450